MYGSAEPEPRTTPTGDSSDPIAARKRPVGLEGADAAGASSLGNSVLEETELDSALQLLVERAQYITGATGTALALPHGDEMVCRASAGSSAPAVGARLQVRSGLTGESISRRQLLRCDNAESDPRVNLEACRALGICSIVVLPLLRRNGEVRGLFELFSDHPYAFEERDLVALERMADLTLTALDLAEQRPAAPAKPKPEAGKAAERITASPAAGPAASLAASAELSREVRREVSREASKEVGSKKPAPQRPAPAEISEARAALPSAALSPSSLSSSLPVTALPVTTPPEQPASVPEAMLRVQKCASCGFPVSEGRTLCLDCEKKDLEKKDATKLRRQETTATLAVAEPGVAAPEEFVPAFLANAAPLQESWLANHVNLLAIVVLILAILVAVVVFR
ncbi:MAG: GAF domain-containing protein [Terriglobales bacterium]